MSVMVKKIILHLIVIVREFLIRIPANSFIALGKVHVVDGKEWIVVCLLLILYIQLFNRLEGLQDIVNMI
jgi:hypothetical protein